MAGRLNLTLLILVCCLAQERLYAQGAPPPGSMATGAYGSAADAVFAQPDMSSAPAWQGFQPAAYGPGPVPGSYPAGGMMPALWTEGQVNAPAEGMPPGPPPGYMTGENGLTYFDNTLLHDEQFDPHCDWLGCCCNPTTKAFFTDLVTESWVRVEYLFWDITDPGGALLGSQMSTVLHPEESFAVTGGTARVPNLGRTELDDVSGVRLTVGAPLDPGTFEVSGFLLQQAADQQIELNQPFGGGSTFIATSTLINGGLAILPNAVRVYDVSYDESFTSEIWGLQANMVFDTAVPGEGLKNQPILGARFLSIQEHLTQTGVSSTAANFITEINSDAKNYVYGVNLGWETSLVHRWFTIGVRPQFTLGANTYQVKVNTNRWVSPSDPFHQSVLQDNNFAALIDITTYLKVPVTENFNLFAGYNILYVFNVERPQTSIAYDTTAIGQVPTAANFRAIEDWKYMSYIGLSVGGEYTFR